jgi:hypothetical protein
VGPSLTPKSQLGAEQLGAEQLGAEQLGAEQLGGEQLGRARCVSAAECARDAALELRRSPPSPWGRRGLLEKPEKRIYFGANRPTPPRLITVQTRCDGLDQMALGLKPQVPSALESPSASLGSFLFPASLDSSSMAEGH